MSTVATSAPQPQGPALSEGARIINTFVAPTKTFTDLNRKPSWFFPWLLLAIFSIVFSYTAGQKVGWAQMNDNQLRLQPKRAAQMEQMPPDQRAGAQAIGEKVTAGISYGWPIMRLIGLMMVAGVLLFSFNFGAGAQLKFNTVLAVVMYASLPEIFRALLGAVFLWTGVVQPDTFIMQNPIGSNLGALATPGSAWWALGTAVDVFGIWALALTAIGITCVSKIKKAPAFAIVFGWAALVALIGAGWTALMS
jgi:hypothetical protein